mmetsp:Transcript_2838/g.8579  ORF Transcript_2838/g.8579 Transcript_2838/m.8579 type:complete len:389 (+) Transcript_2838:227-1393(+)
MLKVRPSLGAMLVLALAAADPGGRRNHTHSDARRQQRRKRARSVARRNHTAIHANPEAFTLSNAASARSLGLVKRQSMTGALCRHTATSGLNNGKDCFYHLCLLALRRGANVSFETVRWNARSPGRAGATLAHERLWDVRHWNQYVSKHGGLPYLVPGPPTSSIRTPGFENLLFLNTFSQPQTQNPSGTLRVAHFHRALRPAPDVLAAAAAAAPKKPYGAVHLRLEKDLDEYRAFKRARLGAKTTFDEMENTASLRACAQGVERLFVAVAVDEVSNAEDKAYLAQKRGPFDSALAFHGGNLSARFGAAALVVGAMIDMEICADAAYFVGYAGLSTFDRALVDVRATRDQWTAGLAVPGNCTFTIRRGDVGKPAGAPSGVHVHHFTSLP